ncbi:glycosyltransferase [Pseudoalteromonas carrageenovora]|uniref:glycosyltransferase n=1 Tax=Pseudoalteromonas carrageenovora TaxID=227 RepID=UPI00311FA44A
MSITKKANLCIPSCGRPHKLRNLIESIMEEDWGNINSVLVVNTTPSHQVDILDEYKILCEEFGLSSIFIPWAGPSEARLKGSEYLSANMPAEYTMFLDDDLSFTNNNLTAMLNFLNNNQHVKLCSATWVDHRNGEKSDRPIGYKYIKSSNGSESKVHKFPLAKKHFNSGYVFVDDAQASILARSSLFEYLNFDPEYEFFMELFDFFYNLHINNVACAVLLDVVFAHFPGDYQTGSQKRNANIKRNKAIDYFKSKWGITPHSLA